MLVKHVSLEEFETLMKKQGYDKEQLFWIYNDMDKCVDNVLFNVDKIKKKYKMANIIYPKNEREYKEFLDNKELGLRLYNEYIGGFIDAHIEDSDILFSNKEEVFYKDLK